MDDRTELTAIDRALSRALDVDVSPEFAARVRQRIAREPVRTPFWRSWRLLVPAAAACVLITAVLALRPARRPAASVPVAAQSSPAASVPSAGVRPASPLPAAGTPPVAVRARVASGPTRSPAATEPEVLVPREEIQMYRRLIANAQNVPGALVVAAPPDIVAAGTIAEIPIQPIKIDPIIPSADGEGDRQ